MARTVVSAIAPFLLAVMVLLANGSAILGVIAIVLCAGLVGLLILGPERAGVACVALAMFLAPMDAVRPPISVITFSDVFLALGMGLLVPTMVRQHARLPISYTIGAYVLVMAGLLASALSPAPASSVLVMSRLVVAAVLLPVFLAWWHPKLRTVDLLVWSYVLGQAFSSLAAFLIGPEANNRYKSLSTHVNYFGHTALIALALTMYLFHRLERGQRWLPVALAALFTVSILQSGSRAAAAVAVLLLVIYPLVERNAATATWVLLGGATVVPLVDWALGRVGGDSPLTRLTGDRTTEHSDTERTRHLEESFDRWLDKPLLGDGFSNAPLAAHNIYLQVLVVTGLVGFIGFILIFLSLLRPLLDHGHPLHRLGYAVFAYAAIGMLTNSLWDRFTWVVLALAFLANLRYDAEEPPPTPPEPARLGLADPAPRRI